MDQNQNPASAEVYIVLNLLYLQFVSCSSSFFPKGVKFGLRSKIGYGLITLSDGHLASLAATLSLQTTAQGVSDSEKFFTNQA